MTTLTGSILARLRASLTAVDARPEVTPGADYVIVTPWAPQSGPRGLQRRAVTERTDVQIMAVSRTREGCRRTLATALDLLDGWRPDPGTATSPLARVSSGPLLTDGPPGDVRHSMTVTLRCTVPYGAALTERTLP